MLVWVICSLTELNHRLPEVGRDLCIHSKQSAQGHIQEVSEDSLFCIEIVGSPYALALECKICITQDPCLTKRLAENFI